MANTTWNPADLVNVTLTGSNLIATAVTGTGTNNGGVRTVASQTTGKYYWEYTLNSLGQTTSAYGIANGSANLGAVGVGAGMCFCTFLSGGITLGGASTGVNLGGNLIVGGTLCLALDMSSKLFWARRSPTDNWNGSSSNNPATGVGGVNISSIAGGSIYALVGYPQDGSPHEQTTANFGDSAFAGAVPSGFTAGFPAAPTTANLTQIAAEQWSDGGARAQLTQVAVEQWALAGTGTGTQVLLTQVALEQWASAGVAAAAAQARAIILA